MLRKVDFNDKNCTMCSSALKPSDIAYERLMYWFRDEYNSDRITEVGFLCEECYDEAFGKEEEANADDASNLARRLCGHDRVVW